MILDSPTNVIIVQIAIGFVSSKQEQLDEGKEIEGERFKLTCTLVTKFMHFLYDLLFTYRELLLSS